MLDNSLQYQLAAQTAATASQNSAATTDADVIVANNAATIATNQATNAASSALSAAVSGVAATNAANLASTNAAIGAAAQNIKSSTAVGVNTGLIGLLSGTLVGGTGGTAGTFSLTIPASPGGGVKAVGTFTVASGAVTAITISIQGTRYTSNVVLSNSAFAASAGLTGASATLQQGGGVDFGQYFLVQSTVSGGAYDVWQNNSGTALFTGNTYANLTTVQQMNNVFSGSAIAPVKSVFPTQYASAVFQNLTVYSPAGSTVAGYIEEFSSVMPQTGTFNFKFLTATTDGSGNFTPKYVSPLQTYVASAGNGFFRWAPPGLTVPISIGDYIGIVSTDASNCVGVSVVTGTNCYVVNNASPTIGVTYPSTVQSNRQIVMSAKIRQYTGLPGASAANSPGGFLMADARGYAPMTAMPEALGSLSAVARVTANAYTQGGSIVSDATYSTSTYTVPYGSVQSDQTIGYPVISWLTASPGFPNSGTLINLQIPALATSVAGNIIRAWVVRPVNLSTGVFTKVAFVGEIDGSVAGRIMEYRNLTIPVLAGDMIAVQGSLNLRTTTASGNTSGVLTGWIKESTVHANLINPVTNADDYLLSNVLASPNTTAFTSGFCAYTATIQTGSFLSKPNTANSVPLLDNNGLIPTALIPIAAGQTPYQLKGLRTYYGAAADTKTAYDAVITAGSVTVTSPSAPFAVGDVGKTFAIPYAAADAGGTYPIGATFLSTIATYVSPTQVTLAAAPIKSIVGSRTITDAAITVNTYTLTSATANFTATDIGKKITIPGAGFLLFNSGGSPLYTRIVGYTNATTVTIQHFAQATVTAQTVTIPGASIIWGTDDTAKLQAAAADTPSMVCVERGQYLVTAPITVSSNWVWKGLGKGIGTIFPVGSGFSPFYYVGTSTTNELHDVTFSNFDIDGLGVRSTAYTTGNKALYVTPIRRATITGMSFRNCASTGLGCDGLPDAVIAENTVDFCGAQVDEFGGGGAGGSGIGIGTGKYQYEPMAIYSNHVTNCGKYGIFFESQSSNVRSRGIRVFGNYCAFNLNGIGDNGNDGILITDNICEYNRAQNILAGPGFVNGVWSINGKIVNNKTRGAGQHEILAQWMDGDYTIQDNECLNNANSAYSSIAAWPITGGTVGPQTLVITGNRGANNAGCGIEVSQVGAGGAVSIQNVYITNNTTKNSNGQPGIRTFINVSGTLRVTNNNSYDDRATKLQTWGFQAQSGTIARLVLTNNDFYSNLTGTYDISGATVTTSIIHDNP